MWGWSPILELRWGRYAAGTGVLYSFGIVWRWPRRARARLAGAEWGLGDPRGTLAWGSGRRPD